MAQPFDTLVQEGIITNPGAIAEGDKAKINALTPAEVAALISIRAKLGDPFIQQNAASIAIVF